MTFARPNLQAIIERIAADIDARLPGADARMPFSNLNVLGYAQGAAVHGLYGYLDYLAQQILPDSADSEYLERWCSIWGIERKASVPATGDVNFTGVSGSTIPTGTLLQRADGQQYQTSNVVVLSGGTGVAPVVAVLAGLAGCSAASSALNLVSPIAGVDSAAVVATGGLTGGSDAEVDESMRDRLLAHIQSPPQGGAAADYIAWALEVPGVTRAWVYPQELGLGTVTVRFVRDGDGTGGAIIPDSTEVAVVQAYINERRPVTADLTVLAPASVALDFTISGLVPATSAVQAAVVAELQDLLMREAVPGGTLLLSHIRAAISAAAGEDDFALTSPTANVVHTVGNMATMGTVTWV